MKYIDIITTDIFEKSGVFSLKVKRRDIMTKKDTSKLISKLFVIIFILLILVVILSIKVIIKI